VNGDVCPSPAGAFEDVEKRRTAMVLEGGSLKTAGEAELRVLVGLTKEP